MASAKNPNAPSKNRLAARAAKARKTQQKRSANGKRTVSHKDAMRGARPGLLPTSGPNARKSSKKARKMQKKLGYALQRKMEEEEGEAMMEGKFFYEEREKERER